MKEIDNIIQKMSSKKNTKIDKQHISGIIYYGNQEHNDNMCKIFSLKIHFKKI